MVSQQVTLVVAIVFLVLVWLAVGLRCYVRLRMLRSWGVDDWCMLLTLALFSVLISFILKSSQLDANAEGAALQENQSISIEFEILSEAVYTATTCALKTSIAFLLLRFTQERLYINILRVSIGFTCAYSLICFFMTLIECSPVAYAWDPSISNGTCITTSQRAGIAYAFSAFTISTDWFYAILPIFLIWGLKMSRLMKFYVTFVLGLGALACIATIVRLTYVVQVASHTTNPRKKTFTDPVIEILIWTFVEPGIGILAACTATLRPLLHYFKILGAADESNPSTAGWPQVRQSWQELSKVQEDRPRNKRHLGSKDGASSEVALCEP